MHLGIFGGSFDPPHIGHLLVAQDAVDALALDRLLVIPAATQPLKGVHRSSSAHRLAMVERCFRGVPAIEVDRVELDRGGLSFMVDTVAHVQATRPGSLVHLLVGEDVLPTLGHWRDPVQLLARVRLAILTRASDFAEAALPEAGVLAARSGESPVVDVAHGQAPESTADIGEAVTRAIGAANRLATRRVDVSSTEIRARVREGRSIRGFVPDAVAEYIASTALYSGDASKMEKPVRA